MIGRAFSRILFGMAVGGAIAAWLRTRERMPARSVPAGKARPEWYSDHAPGADGRLDADALADEASEDSFPASDPPAHMSSLTLGSPARPEEPPRKKSRRRSRRAEPAEV